MLLGPFEIEHPFILAPMAGITNSPFRRLMRQYGSAITVSELVSANGMVYGGKRTKDLLHFVDDERMVGIQIFGESTENLCKAAKEIEKLGADFVDLNLGCPVKKVVKKGAGSAMCRDPRELYKVLKALVSSVQIPVSIKVRSGWDDDSKNIHDVVAAGADAGVCWVAIHGRTRAQGYSGLADWDLIAEAKVKSSVPIIGNGDITTPEIAVSRVRDFGLDAVMIGRGALKNPFIFREAEFLWRGQKYLAATSADYQQLFLQQKLFLREAYEERVALLHSKKFLSWYSAGYRGSNELRKAVFKQTDFATLWALGEDFFASNFSLGLTRSQEFMSQPFLQGGHG